MLDANEVVERGPLQLGECYIKTRHYPVQCMSTPGPIVRSCHEQKNNTVQVSHTMLDPEVASHERASKTAAAEEVAKVEALGIPPGTSKGMVQLFFENAGKSGGGVIKHLEYNVDSGHTLVQFENQKGNV